MSEVRVEVFGGSVFRAFARAEGQRFVRVFGFFFFRGAPAADRTKGLLLFPLHSLALLLHTTAPPPSISLSLSRDASQGCRRFSWPRSRPPPPPSPPWPRRRCRCCRCGRDGRRRRCCDCRRAPEADHHRGRGASAAAAGVRDAAAPGVRHHDHLVGHVRLVVELVCAAFHHHHRGHGAAAAAADLRRSGAAACRHVRRVGSAAVRHRGATADAVRLSTSSATSARHVRATAAAIGATVCSTAVGTAVCSAANDAAGSSAAAAATTLHLAAAGAACSIGPRVRSGPVAATGLCSSLRAATV